MCGTVVMDDPKPISSWMNIGIHQHLETSQLDEAFDPNFLVRFKRAQSNYQKKLEMYIEGEEPTF